MNTTKKPPTESTGRERGMLDKSENIYNESLAYSDGYFNDRYEFTDADAPPPSDQSYDLFPTTEGKRQIVPEREEPIADWEDTDFHTLLTTDWGAIDWYIEGIVHDGLIMLASMPKLGKSILAMNMAVSIASGTDFWGIKTKKARVAYLALEDSNRRLKSRAWKMCPLGTDFKKCDLHFITTTRNIDEGFSVQLDSFKAKYPDTGVVIVDILQRVRGNGNRKGKNAYEFDTYEMQRFKDAADKHGISLMLITHDSKVKPSQNVVDGFSGSRGLSGMADCLLTVSTVPDNPKRAVLSVKTREAESQQYLMEHGADDRLEWRLVEKQEFAENITGKTEHAADGNVTKQKQCEEWLSDLIEDAGGWIRIGQAYEIGKRQGYNEKIIKRAKNGLDYLLTARRGEKGNTRFWYVDGHEPPEDMDDLKDFDGWKDIDGDSNIGDIFPKHEEPIPEQTTI